MKRFLLPILFALFISPTLKAQFTVVPTNAFCWGTCTGSAFLTGTADHYYWSNGDTMTIEQGLCAGSYWVNIYDSGNNLLDSLNFFIGEPPQLNIAGAATTDVTCFGAMDGSIFSTASGGTPPYNYTWSPGIANTQNAFNLPAGAYTITITDANGCSVSNVYFINQPTALTQLDTSFMASSCTACDGSISINVSGGVTPYSYNWSNNATTQNINNLCQGYYSYTVTDANGCTISNTDLVQAGSNGLTATASNTGILCNNPDITTINVSSGVPPYTINWADGTNSAWGNGPFQHGYVSQAVYWIDITDTAGCVFIIQDSVLNSSVDVSITYINEPSCSQPHIGELGAIVVNGFPPYFYLWNNGSTTDSAVNLSAGNYQVTVTDSLGCSASASALLSTNGTTYAYAYGNAASCDSGGLGSATIYISGGNPPYTYMWSTVPPQTTQTAFGIPPGNYTFTVTDNTGCQTVNTANITFSSFSFYAYTTIDTPPNCGVNNGVVTVHPYYGSGGYTYHWDDNQTTATAVHLAPGNHLVTVTDAGGCVANGSASLQYTCFNTITGNIFNDANGNCTLDSGETFLSGTIYADNGIHTYYAYTNNAGTYTIQVSDSGTFTVHAQIFSYQVCGNMTACNNATQPVTFHGFNNTAGNFNFGFVGSTGFDLYLHPGWMPANPGFNKDYWVFYGNQSAQTFTGAATVSFKYDSNLTYLGCDPPLPTHNPTTHTLSWAVTGVGNWDFRGYCHFNVPASLPAGYLLQSDFKITPTTGDCDSSSNHMHFSELVTSSRDPNEKEVSPAGAIYEDDSVLTYSIRFQNTGTDTTWFIIVKDTLSHNLDPLTVKNLASSHPYSQFNISGEGILTWVFNPIFLVDSTTNEPASKGFVMFSIKKRKDLPIGSTISNKAYIYFDYNEPVVTNTVADTVADPNYIFEVHGDPNVSVSAFPNPFSQATHIIVSGLNEKFDFTLLDVTGRMKRTISSIATNQFEIQRDDLAAGVYFYKISTGKRQVAYGKLVVQ